MIKIYNETFLEYENSLWAIVKICLCLTIIEWMVLIVGNKTLFLKLVDAK